MNTHCQFGRSSKRAARPLATLLTRTLLGLGAVIAITNTAPAQNLPNSVLNGCYSYREHTTATSSPLLLGKGQEALGTMCFNGLGGAASANDGHVVSTNGVVTATAGTNSKIGNYAVTNTPYYGMGRINYPSLIGYWMAVNKIGIGAPTGVAHGYQLMRVAGDVSAEILGGTAFYQAASGINYTAAVLTGCYSTLSETTLTAPVATGIGKDILSVVCFSGGGGSSGTLTTGYIRDVNGTLAYIPVTGGNYTINNAPGWGMGIMSIGTCPTSCVTYELAVHDVSGTPALAGGFQFTLLKPTPNGNTVMEGGDAEYQQP
jgi:hypothetical protein